MKNKYVAEFISRNDKYIDEYQLTFFEVTTAMAFQYFKETKTDFCVIETGLGGRLDSTNVLNPLAVVITTISLEHTNVLGNTIEQIASEKAAIIKNDTKVFTGLLKPEAERIVREKCIEKQSQYLPLKKYLVEGSSESIRILDNKIFEINPPLKGSYQKTNAALAALTVAETFSKFDEQKFKNGIKNVSKNTGLTGRYEIYHKSPRIIFDSAHNLEGIENFLNEFNKEASQYDKRFLIFGAMRDKAIEEMIKKLGEYFDELLLSEIQYERAAKPSEIHEICNRLDVRSRILNQPAGFIKEFKNSESSNCLVVLGSMYLLGEIKLQLQG
ncbi:MAG: hypothetical protein IPM14_17120 [bacterium]|nr:hypothetical protein [bacterium]